MGPPRARTFCVPLRNLMRPQSEAPPTFPAVDYVLFGMVLESARKWTIGGKRGPASFSAFAETEATYGFPPTSEGEAEPHFPVAANRGPA